MKKTCENLKRTHTIENRISTIANCEFRIKFNGNIKVYIEIIIHKMRIINNITEINEVIRKKIL